MQKEQPALITHSNWNAYPELREAPFTPEELQCKETGELEMSLEFLQNLILLRKKVDRPFIITSAYRSPNHSVERKKSRPGPHALGVAIDIALKFSRSATPRALVGFAHDISHEAEMMPYFGRNGGIGRLMHGDWSGRYIHLDGWVSVYRPAQWTYKR